MKPPKSEIRRFQGRARARSRRDHRSRLMSDWRSEPRRACNGHIQNGRDRPEPLRWAQAAPIRRFHFTTVSSIRKMWARSTVLAHLSGSEQTRDLCISPSRALHAARLSLYEKRNCDLVMISQYLDLISHFGGFICHVGW